MKADKASASQRIQMYRNLFFNLRVYLLLYQHVFQILNLYRNSTILNLFCKYHYIFFNKPYISNILSNHSAKYLNSTKILTGSFEVEKLCKEQLSIVSFLTEAEINKVS